MSKVQVKVRTVGESAVVTIPKSILEDFHVSPGDNVELRTIGATSLMIRKEGTNIVDGKRMRLEVELLQKRQAHAHAVSEKVGAEIFNGRGQEWGIASVVEQEAGLAVEMAAKRLELYDLTGQPDIEAALDHLDPEEISTDPPSA